MTTTYLQQLASRAAASSTDTSIKAAYEGIALHGAGLTVETAAHIILEAGTAGPIENAAQFCIDNLRHMAGPLRSALKLQTTIARAKKAVRAGKI